MNPITVLSLFVIQKATERGVSGMLLRLSVRDQVSELYRGKGKNYGFVYFSYFNPLNIELSPICQ